MAQRKTDGVTAVCRGTLTYVSSVSLGNNGHRVCRLEVDAGGFPMACLAFDEKAEEASSHRKGDVVEVEGDLEVTRWRLRGGRGHRKTIRLRVNEVRDAR